ncbi:TPA: DUF3800 domain-containing protein [Bacillus paranthracis]|uniref:DUF3800 domain-containing protein n=1 Tax=Bacillus cereus group TaxID=86661 RepID=UPI0005CE393C|nr:DUF3800 domain-containing protein [Bacillus paranthracis]MBG9905053.1 hypothetical protein [Bacillus paranthracis]MDK7423444.1 DUF3800 domain-containing protein [Bacillus paranthracis]MDK7451144.1 DUF3800 domain-containing protein [Bacillus paranthracis]MDK7463185.1 DUF3800 domain-containing protein [Bacillus paranthracis]MDK7532022.1 DUF3800 domain-containing protein [Bacillus paranthracis]
MQYIIYCDESEKNGKFFGNFYGGALVRSIHFHEVKDALAAKKAELGFSGEVKWQKVTANYLEKYMELMKCFFDFIKQDKVKIRIMFTHNKNLATNLTKEQRDKEYFLLYYQFFKHAFGFQYSNNTRNSISLYTYFDQLPDTKEKNREFIDYIYKLQYMEEFKKANLFFNSKDDIAEAKSHNHDILQCLDVILGAMEFRLNEKHKAKPEGQRTRGKRTIAKEKLYKFINQNIREIYPNFNIGESTGKSSIGDKWLHPYRHWKFTPSVGKVDKHYVGKKKR